MPILNAAKKAMRQNKRRKALNSQYKKKMKEPIKEFKKLLAEKKAGEAKKLLSRIYKALDKSAKHGTIKKNTAARRKSRLTKMVNKMAR
ncbi:MAG: 30S ribosomal protein S20 [Candidatus Portnoybacteria bacterium]|nr:30S ribosomal protein S20 [Candidatus Portnoybacteria bacterium]